MTRPNIAVVTFGAAAADALFDASAPVNRDDCLCGFRAFRDAVQARGGQVHTHDVFLQQGVSPDIVVFLDVPNKPPQQLIPHWPSARRWLILQECEVVLPRNWDRRNHADFERCFTWHPGWIDGDRYFRLDFANPLLRPRQGASFEQRKLATLVAGNKSSRHPLELYSERVATIRWFERNAPADFDFYGIGWDRRRFAGPLKPFNRVDVLAKAAARSWPSWRGATEDKLATLSEHRFTICYENAREIPGYVTEKLFDAFSAGTVPVYWGAPDISERVPRDCFIDRRDFQSHADMVDRLRTMDESEHLEFVERIGAFLRSDAARPYSAQAFGETLGSAAFDAPAA